METRSDIQRRWRLMPRSGSGGNLGARLKTRPSCFPAYSPRGQLRYYVFGSMPPHLVDEIGEEAVLSTKHVEKWSKNIL